MDGDMAKRGRPKKIKIILPKNPVGRPEATKKDNAVLWLYCLLDEMKMEYGEIVKIIAENVHRSKKSVEGTITTFRKKVIAERLIIQADPHTGRVYVVGQPSELSQSIGLILPKTPPTFINLDDFFIKR